MSTTSDRCASNRTDLSVHMPPSDAPNAYSGEWADDCDRAHELLAACGASERVSYDVRCSSTILPTWAEIDAGRCAARH